MLPHVETVLPEHVETVLPEHVETVLPEHVETVLPEHVLSQFPRPSKLETYIKVFYVTTSLHSTQQ